MELMMHCEVFLWYLTYKYACILGLEMKEGGKYLPVFSMPVHVQCTIIFFFTSVNDIYMYLHI